MISGAVSQIRRARISYPMGDLSFWISVAVFPIAVLVVGSLLRLYKDAPQTSATDVFGLLIIFDGLVVGDSAHFARFVASGQASGLTWIMVVLAFFSIVTWAFCLLEVEPKIINYHVDGFTD